MDRHPTVISAPMTKCASVPAHESHPLMIVRAKPDCLARSRQHDIVFSAVRTHAPYEPLGNHAEQEKENDRFKRHRNGISISMARTIPVQQYLVQLTFQLILINRHLYNVPIEPLWPGIIEPESSRKAQKSQPLGLAFFISDQ